MNNQSATPSTPDDATSLPPGAGSPLQPGPPLSVSAPIRDRAINWGLLALIGGAAVLALIVLVVVIGLVGALFAGHAGGGSAR